MWCRLLCGVSGSLMCLGLCGCYPTAQSQLDEQKNPYFLAGRERVTARDYKRAIEAFEKALEENPRSALAHYELGLLYEQHENDYAAAIYHYNRAIKFRPDAYPAEYARALLAGCKRELVKADALAVVNPTVLRDLERAREENRQLRKQLEGWQAFYASRASVQTPPATAQSQAASPSLRPNPAAAPDFSRPDSAGPARGVTPLPAPDRTMSSARVPAATKTHIIKDRETLTSIARQYGVKVDALLVANPSADPRRLRPGQTLKIPSS